MELQKGFATGRDYLKQHISFAKRLKRLAAADFDSAGAGEFKVVAETGTLVANILRRTGID